MQEGDYLASVDLTVAYLLIPILGENKTTHRKYRILYRSMPFGFMAEPCVFTKLLVTLVAHLRCWGVAFHPFQDNFLIRSLSREKTQGHPADMPMSPHMGFLINRDKSP